MVVFFDEKDMRLCYREKYSSAFFAASFNGKGQVCSCKRQCASVYTVASSLQFDKVMSCLSSSKSTTCGCAIAKGILQLPWQCHPTRATKFVQPRMTSFQ